MGSAVFLLKFKGTYETPNAAKKEILNWQGLGLKQQQQQKLCNTWTEEEEEVVSAIEKEFEPSISSKEFEL